MTVPKESKISAYSIDFEFPNLFPIPAEKSEKVAKVNSGKVVRNPAQPLDSPRSSLIKGINGPTAVMEGRRLKETKRIPKIRNHVFWWKEGAEIFNL